MPRWPERQNEFGAALLIPERPIPAGLVGPDGLPSARRFGVYRNNVYVGLAAALRAGFPCVERLVGEEFFAAMARAFVAVQPPASPILLHYGAGFPDFIESFGPASALPYLAGVARIERAATEAYHARDAAFLDLTGLAAVPAEKAFALRFRLHPSVQLLRSSFPAFTIWQMNTAGGTPAPVDLAESQDTLVLRPDAQVDVRRVLPASHDFLAALGEGITLARAMARATDADPDFDLSLHLGELIRIGAFESFTLPEEEDDDRSAR